MLRSNSVLLDTARPGPLDRRTALLFEDPVEIIEAHLPEEVPGVLERLQEQAAAGFWCAGYLAYEAGSVLEPGLQQDSSGGRLAWFGVYRSPRQIEVDELEALLARADDFEVAEGRFAWSLADYAARLDRVREHIRQGDVYQINLTAPLTFRFGGDPVGLYRDLRRKQRVAFGGIIRIDDEWILTLSPELFVRRDGDLLTTRPMKGTIRRGATATEDEERRRWLAGDPKNQAENLMIVDLLRNDLSRVSEPGSVRVASMFDTERYETLWQMTSTVLAQAQENVGVAEVLRAIFPCGSVTGAPKHRAMEIIRELEDGPRGPYCGAIGLVEPSGDFVFNVPIRTVEICGDRGRMGIGSGVVWDSEAETEYEECLLKARFLTDPSPPEFALLETMRAVEGQIPLLSNHLERLRASADYFGFAFDEYAVIERLKEIGEGELRLRLTVGRDSEVAVDTSPLEDRPLDRAVIFPRPADPDDPFQRHKTTHRPFYDQALAFAHEHGADEAILVNDRGEIVEGSFTNVWIRRGGKLLTPAARSGGLGGVYRAHLLATRGDAEEAVLTVDDLLAAREVYLSNAVRGLRQVRIIAADRPRQL